MSDLEQLWLLTDQVRPPAFASLQDVARRRDQRARIAAAAGTAVALVVAATAFLTVRSDDRTGEPIAPDPDRTQTLVDAEYGTEQVHRFETHEVSNSGEHAGETDLSVTADSYEGSTWTWWCSGDPTVSYAVQITRGSDGDGPVGVPVWRAAGPCDGKVRGDGNGFSGTGPPAAPSDSMSSQNMRFSPLHNDEGAPTTVRVVLTEAIPDAIAGCFDLPGGPVPKPCTDTDVPPLASPGDVEFGAVIFTRPVEYVAEVAGIPVQAQASTDGVEYLFAGGVESVPGTEKVTLETNEPGFVYVVQSDPVGTAECQDAYEKAEAEGNGFLYQGDTQSWDCTMKEAKLRLLVDGEPVAEDETFPQSGDWQGWFDFGSSALDSGHHVITVERVKGDPRVLYGLVLFEES